MNTAKYIFSTIAIVLLIWIIGWVVIQFGSSNLNSNQPISDIFNSINTLFTGLSFSIIIVAVILQNKELVLQREELKLQRKEMSLNREELKKSAEAQLEMLKSINNQIFIQLQSTELIGRSAIISGLATKLKRYSGSEIENWINKKEYNQDQWAKEKDYYNLLSDLELEISRTSVLSDNIQMILNKINFEHLGTEIKNNNVNT